MDQFRRRWFLAGLAAAAASLRAQAAAPSAEERLDLAKKRLAEIDRKIAEIDHADAQKAQQRREKQQLRLRAYELTRARMLDFVGAPDVQMQLAARLWGHCCRCGRELTDPVSLERGIGPDCWNDICNGIRRLAAEGERREVISWLVGVPLELLDTILGEQP